MKILDRYIIFQIIKVSIIVILALSFVLAGVELFTRIDTIVQSHIPFLSVVKYLLLSLPQYLMLMASFSFLFSSTLFFTSLSANNERIALLNAGVGKRRIAIPIIILALIFTLLGVYFQETALKEINISHDKMQQELFGSSSTKDKRNIALKDDKGNLIFATRFSESTNTLYSPILILTHDGTIDNRIEGEYAEYNEDDFSWTFYNCDIYTVENGKKLLSKRERYFTPSSFTLESDFFKSENINVETMDYKTALSYLDRLKSVDIDSWHEKATTFLEAKFKPFGILILVIMATLLSYNYKKNTLILSMGKSIFIMVIYYISNMVISIVCKQGVLSPIFVIIVPTLGSLLATLLINLVAKLIEKG